MLPRRERATAAESYYSFPGPAHAWRSVRRRLSARARIRGVRRGARRAAASRRGGSMRVGPGSPTTIPFRPHSDVAPSFFPSLLISSTPALPRGTPRRPAKKSACLFGAPDLYKRAPRTGTPPLRIRTARPIGPRRAAHTGRPPRFLGTGRASSLSPFSTRLGAACSGRPGHHTHTTRNLVCSQLAALGWSRRTGAVEAAGSGAGGDGRGRP